MEQVEETVRTWRKKIRKVDRKKRIDRGRKKKKEKSKKASGQKETA